MANLKKCLHSFYRYTNIYKIEGPTLYCMNILRYYYNVTVIDSNNSPKCGCFTTMGFVFTDSMLQEIKAKKHYKV